MDSEDDPYEILEIPPPHSAATDAIIRKAYFRLAKVHHPDRGSGGNNNNGGENHHHIFAKISNAYELLSDPEQRREYDLRKQYGNGNGNGQFPSDQDFYPRSSRPSSSSKKTSSHRFHDDFHFHDPFQVFQQFFQDFSSGFDNDHDPFFSHSFHNSIHQRHHNRQHPQGRRQQQQQQHGDFLSNPFSMSSAFSSNHGDPFGMNMMSSFTNSMGGGGAFPHANNNVFSSSISSSSTMGNGPTSVSTSTTTRIVNGKQETVTERIVQHADGRVERQVQNSSGSSNRDGRIRNSRMGQIRDNDDRYQRRSLDNHPNSLLTGHRHPRDVVDLTGEDDDDYDDMISSHQLHKSSVRPRQQQLKGSTVKPRDKKVKRKTTSSSRSSRK